MFFRANHFIRRTGEYHRRRMYFTVTALQGGSRRHHVSRVFCVRSDLYWSKKHFAVQGIHEIQRNRLRSKHRLHRTSEKQPRGQRCYGITHHIA